MIIWYYDVMCISLYTYCVSHTYDVYTSNYIHSLLHDASHKYIPRSSSPLAPFELKLVLINAARPVHDATAWSSEWIQGSSFLLTDWWRAVPSKCTMAGNLARTSSWTSEDGWTSWRIMTHTCDSLGPIAKNEDIKPVRRREKQHSDYIHSNRPFALQLNWNLNSSISRS